MRTLVIGGHFSPSRGDSLRHKDGFRLAVDSVTMDMPNLVSYFQNGRKVDNVENRLLAEERLPYRQVYWSGLHLYNLMLNNDYAADILHCHDVSDPYRFQLYSKNPTCVIVSTTFMNIQAVAAVVKDVREHLPETCIIIGGAYARHSYMVWQRQADEHYTVPEIRNNYFFTMDNPLEEIDIYVFDQHGEKTLLQVLEIMKNGAAPKDIDNTVVPEQGLDGTKWRFNREVVEDYNIDDHRIQWKTIPKLALAGVIPFQNTYGCPFKCTFCNFSQTKVHKKTANGLIEELQELAERDVAHTIWFTDDNFLLNEKLITEFCIEYIKIGAPFKWKSFVRASCISAKSVPLLKEANCSMLMLGLESGSQTVIDNIEKSDNIEHYAEAINLLVANDIDLELSFIIGLPGENNKTLQETIDFINNIPDSPTQITWLYLFGFNVLPLSPVFEKNQREKWQLEGYLDKWSHTTMSSEDVPGALRHVAANVKSTVFNYIDADMGLDRCDAIEIMRVRDVLGRNILQYGPKHSSNVSLWDKLESLVREKLMVNS